MDHWRLDLGESERLKKVEPLFCLFHYSVITHSFIRCNSSLLGYAGPKHFKAAIPVVFALGGFDAVRSIVASTKAANDFEISSSGRSFRKIRCSIASRIMAWNSTNGALPASLDLF